MIVMLFLCLWLGVCGYALWRGGRPEQFVSLSFVVAFVLTVASDQLGYQWHGIQMGTFFVDVMLLIVLVAIALRANRYWPIGIAAMQALAVIGTLLMLADPHMVPLLYWLSSVVWAYPMLILLALGTVRHRNREKRLGPEPSWSSSSPPSG